VTIVAILMAGIIDTGYYCMDGEGNVYRFDPRRQKAVGLPMSELIARRVREAIETREKGDKAEGSAAGKASLSRGAEDLGEAVKTSTEWA
jgi:hypothetical protein